MRFLEELFGDRLVFIHYTYDRSEPGTPGISLHTDGQPYGSKIFGYEGSCPITVRVLYYLDDLTLDVSPFRVVPRSHLCMHADAHPYKRYERHPEEVVVPCTAGSALFLNHGRSTAPCPTGATGSRAMLAVAYRPAWAGPIVDVEPRDPSDLERMPDSVRPFLGDPSMRTYEFASAQAGGHVGQRARNEPEPLGTAGVAGGRPLNRGAPVRTGQ